MMHGIDVSVYQGAINWSEVKKASIEFAGMKATEGLQFEDPQFVRNWKQSKEHGIRRIAYHFFHADIDGAAQADYFHNWVHDGGGFGHGDCAMLDIETLNGMNAAQLVQQAERFITQFLRTTQCGLYIYTGPWFWESLLGGPRSAIIGKCPLWIANWSSVPGNISNWPSGPAIWQWTASMSVPGIAGTVDGDRFLGTVKQYDLLAQFGGRK